MPEPTADPKQATDQPVSQPVTVDAAALGRSISEGLAKELGPILSRDAAQAKDREAVSPPSPPPLPQEPSYDEIMEAIRSGEDQKAARLMAQRDRAREARLDRELIQPLRDQGAQAISSMAKQAGQQYLAELPSKYHGEVNELIDGARRANGMVTSDHWREAVSLVYGRHRKEIEDAAVETRLRQQREAAESPKPGQGGGDEDEEQEAATLHEEFGPTFREEFKLKSRAKGGLTEDAEVQALNRGIKSARLQDEKGRNVRDYTVKDYLKERREMRRIAEELPSLGLDE